MGMKEPSERMKIRAKMIATDYIDSGLDGTKTGMKHYKAKSPKIASAIMTENLNKPVFQKAIIQVLEERGLKDDIISDIQLRNIKQEKNYSASNEAIKLYHQLKGNLIERKETKNLNITMTEEQLDQAIKNAKDQLEGI
jgi:hypothetical protein